MLARATDDAWLVERAGGSVRVVESTPANLKVTTPHDLADRRAAAARAMLTDYHVHLRPDEPDTPPERYFTAANAERYRVAAEEHGITELGVSEHIYRFPPRWTSGSTRSGGPWAVDDLDAYCEFVREETDLRLGIEADFVPGREDRIATLLEAREWDYVVGSIHFLRDFSIDSDEYTVWRSGESAERVWRRYFETLAESARSGLYDIIGHPDLVKVWGDRAPRPDGDLRRYYEPAVEAFAESGVAVEVSTAGLRKPVGEIYPARPYLEMLVDAGCPIALSSDAHDAGPAGLPLRGGARAARLGRRARAGGVRAPRAPDGADRLMARTGIGIDSHAFAPGRRLVLGGVEIPHDAGLRGHSDADVLSHAIIDALLGAAGLGDIGQHFPDTDPRLEGRRLDGAAAPRRRPRGRGRARRRDGDDGAPASSRRYRDAIRDSLAAALGGASVNVKATTGEGMGFVGRGEGVAALAVATLEVGTLGLAEAAPTLLGPEARLRPDAGPSGVVRASRRAAAWARSCSCSTWRLSWRSERPRWPLTVRAAIRSATQPDRPGAGDAVLEAQLDARAAAVALADPPAPALVDAGHRHPRQVAVGLELDHLDQPADLGRADAQQHPVAGAEPAGLLAVDRPAGDAGHEVQVALGVGDQRPHQLGRRVDLDRLGDPHPITGSRRSAASASSVSCIRRMTWS